MVLPPTLTAMIRPLLLTLIVLPEPLRISSAMPSRLVSGPLWIAAAPLMGAKAALLTVIWVRPVPSIFNAVVEVLAYPLNAESMVPRLLMGKPLPVRNIEGLPVVPEVTSAPLLTSKARLLAVAT